MAKPVVTDEELLKQNRDLECELRELREYNQELRDSLKLEKQLTRSSKLQLAAIYDSFFQERSDLLARVLRIDQRILALGYKVPVDSASVSAVMIRNQ